MRELKFRAWNEGKNAFGSVKKGTKGKMLHDLETKDKPLWWLTSLKLPVMQYTNIKDKNNMEVYEGDIIKITQLYLDDDWYEILEVRWASNGYHLYEKNSVGWRATLSWHEEKFQIEVIGNIYENPELLNG